MEEIITATGKIFKVDMVCSIPQYVYIRIVDSDMQTIRSVFSDPNETIIIQYGDYALLNYVRLGYAQYENGAIKVRLDKNG